MLLDAARGRKGETLALEEDETEEEEEEEKSGLATRGEERL